MLQQPLLPSNAMCDNPNRHVLQTIYGDFIITEPVLIDLLNDPFMERLKSVRQYGPCYYSMRPIAYTRYDHSVGVLALLRRYHASLEEQIAGLLHDVSHTVFSHVGDYLFKGSYILGDSYQDHIHEKFIQQTTLGAILERYNFKITDVAHKNQWFMALERPLPDVCADRLEYNLQGALAEGILLQVDIAQILNALFFEHGKWIFSEVDSAKKFAYVSLYLTEHVWGSAQGALTHELTARALQHGLDTGLVTHDEIHFSTDEKVWKQLLSSNNSAIEMIIQKVLNYNQYFQHVEDGSYDYVIRTKFRGIDPWVRSNGTDVVRLATIDAQFCRDYGDLQQRIQRGWRIKYIK